MNDGEPYALELVQLREYQKVKANLAHCRKRREEIEDQKLRKVGYPDLRKKLLTALGQDDDCVIRPDLYHLLVLSPLEGDKKETFIKENLQFVGTMEWKLALDFDCESKICDYLVEEKEIPVKIISTPEKFDRKKTRVTLEKVHSLQEDLKNSADLSWLFCNGLKKSDIASADNPREWKRNLGPSFKECIMFFSREIPDERAVVVFLLFSKNYEVMLEAADDLCTMFPDQFVCIAENESIANPWKEKLLAKNCVDKEVLEAKTIVGLPWGHVQEIFQNLTDPQLSMIPKLPTSLGAPVSLSVSDRQEMSDLDILALNECQDCDLHDSEFNKLQQESEENFYHGKRVTWWNFWFPSQVCKRKIHDGLKRQVEETLRGDYEVDSKVAKVTLFHERGAGGTTAAKHVLWDLKDQYRCAVVKDITENTCSQILKYRLYKEAEQIDPKPVLIMIDPADDEKVSLLLSQLEEKAKHTMRFENRNTFCVLLMVTSRSKAKTGQKIPGPHESLKHELDSRELQWFNKKKKELNDKFKHHKGADPKMMISFNILRENFGEKYIKETTDGLLKAVTNPQERKLLKYLSLLNAFDLITRQEVPTAVFDKLMRPDETQRSKKKKHWETTLSSEVKVLLNVTSRQAMRKIQALSIIHPLLAKEVQYALCLTDKGTRQSLSDSVLELFDQDFVNVTPERSHATTEILHRIISCILVKRKRYSNCLPETEFSPLIEEIRKRESADKAGIVLQQGFHLTRDAFVAQQVSRLFIRTRSWKIALEYARTAVEMKRENPCIWDTLGRVYKFQVQERLENFTQRDPDSKVTSEEVLETVQLSLEAIEQFRTEQKVALADNSPLENEVVAYIGELDASVRMLDCLTCLEVFREDREKLHRFLVDRLFVPAEIYEWKDKKGVDYVQELKNLQNSVYEVIAKIEDEQIQQKLETIDEYKCSQAKTISDNLVQLKEHIDSYYGEQDDNVPENLSPEDKCMYRRRRVFRLGGRSLTGIYGLRRYEGGEKKLLKILKHVNENLSSGQPTNVDDLRVKITVVLALSCIRERYVHQFKMADMIEWCTELYYIKSDFRPIRLEPYLFYVMFGWPRKCTQNMSLSPSAVEEAIGYWKEAYFEKYPRRAGLPIKKKDTTIFFLANGSDMASVIDYDRLKGEGGRLKGDDQFWRTASIIRKLQRFRGTLSDDGYSVSVHVEYGQGHKGKIRIPTSRAISDRRLWNKTVYFVIGFSWMTPKAFDVMGKDITDDPNVFTTGPGEFTGQDIFSPVELPSEHSLPVLTQISFWTKMSQIEKDLNRLKHRGYSDEVSKVFASLHVYLLLSSSNQKPQL